MNERRRRASERTGKRTGKAAARRTVRIRTCSSPSVGRGSGHGGHLHGEAGLRPAPLAKRRNRPRRSAQVNVQGKNVHGAERRALSTASELKRENCAAFHAHHLLACNRWHGKSSISPMGSRPTTPTPKSLPPPYRLGGGCPGDSAHVRRPSPTTTPPGCGRH